MVAFSLRGYDVASATRACGVTLPSRRCEHDLPRRGEECVCLPVRVTGLRVCPPAADSYMDLLRVAPSSSSARLSSVASRTAADRMRRSMPACRTHKVTVHSKRSGATGVKRTATPDDDVQDEQDAVTHTRTASGGDVAPLAAVEATAVTTAGPTPSGAGPSHTGTSATAKSRVGSGGSTVSSGGRAGISKARASHSVSVDHLSVHPSGHPAHGRTTSTSSAWNDATPGGGALPVASEGRSGCNRGLGLPTAKQVWLGSSGCDGVLFLLKLEAAGACLYQW